MKCRCGAPPIWVEMAPRSLHRYSIRCSKCEKQARWGSIVEFEGLLEEGGDGLIRTYAEQIAQPPDPFAPFIED